MFHEIDLMSQGAYVYQALQVLSSLRQLGYLKCQNQILLNMGKKLQKRYSSHQPFGSVQKKQPALAPCYSRVLLRTMRKCPMSCAFRH
jgi:hypothetical protein